eukprot:CAMPEP_0185570684 /NCGR_PEP_ID=MMETSP0434-20130131/2913_1 /TAXON_ID=626734 ORGANISM="Favella taraikaensis, Strain Fe Narragansett Bay" /NCGR_SAMPLE_ID=MMETSP0434 /ASSEMBLY_ACC=CAM_ASM_000379 /LENGTH=42 /DNA_ID= /DNA_START= /DNA_END= /DNA_ORIENTATION=
MVSDLRTIVLLRCALGIVYFGCCLPIGEFDEYAPGPGVSLGP